MNGSCRSGELRAHALGSQRRPEKADDPQGRPQDQAHQQLMAEHPRPVADLHLAQGHGPGDQRGRLGPRITARRDAQRHEQAQHHHLGNGVLEVRQGGEGQQLGQEQTRQPDGPAAPQA